MHMVSVFFTFLFFINSFLFAENDLNSDFAQVVVPRSYGSNIIIYNREPGYLTVYNNMPSANWKLYRYSNLIFVGTGQTYDFQVPEGDGYLIVPDEIEGYTVKVYPPFTFRMYSGDYFSIQIVYERTYGYVNIKSSFPDGEVVEAKLIPEDPEVRPISIKMKSSKGKIDWQSAPVPTGFYEIVYKLAEKHQQISPQRLFVKRGETLYLTPRFFTPGKLTVSSNIGQAVYDLRSANNAKSWRGQGQNYTFSGLTAGSYVLTFGVRGTDFYIPPKEMKVNINDYENKEIKVSYQPAGKLTLSTNVERTDITIDDLSASRKTFKEELVGGSKTVTLPQGKYRITFSDQENLAAPAPMEFELLPFRNERISGTYHKQMPTGEEKMAKLIINTNIQEGGYDVTKVSGDTQEAVGHFTGKMNSVQVQGSESYEIKFDNVPNYRTPDNLSVRLNSGEQKTINANYTLASRQTVFVPSGRAIIGEQSSDQANTLPSKTVTISAFEIGIYEVTNREFSDWLNKAIKQKKIAYVSEADQRGRVLDLSGNLLFKTFEADSYSQISAQSPIGNEATFSPIAGKEIYPVINVSWHGAVAYCKDNDCRLPTEAEWEKAAGMQPEKTGEPLKKYRYGFSRDEIDRTWANYKDSDQGIQRFQVLTTPVGFYNGTNLLPLSLSSKHQEQTHLAQSPYGGFDFSGNVWEWVSDWYDDAYVDNMSETDPQGPKTGTQKVVKGGCYDSLADGVRVAERMGLASDHADSYTGFRIAKDIKK